MKEWLNRNDLEKIYKGIYRDGYFSAGAGDMWEPEYDIEDLLKVVNNRLNAMIANGSLLKELLKDAPMLWGRSTGSPNHWRGEGEHWMWAQDDEQLVDCTHKARLACIEEIVNE